MTIPIAYLNEVDIDSVLPQSAVPYHPQFCTYIWHMFYVNAAGWCSGNDCNAARVRVHDIDSIKVGVAMHNA
jgi:hypothetical protein